MSQYLNLEKKKKKIKAFVELSQKSLLHNVKPLPKNSNKLLEHLLIHGEVTRGEAQEVLDVSAPTAISNINSKNASKPFNVKGPLPSLYPLNCSSAFAKNFL